MPSSTNNPNVPIEGILEDSVNAKALANPRAKQFNTELRFSLEQYRVANNLTHSQLARELCTNVTAVSKYLNGKPEGDVSKLEAVIEDVLRTAAIRSIVRIALFATCVTRVIERRLETIRKTNDCGLIYGDAGLGKSRGAELYLNQSPSTVYVELPIWHANRDGILGVIWNAIETGSWNGYTLRSDYLTARLKDSNRLIIVDNAHLLTSGARTWLFNFHDLTRCPIAFMGNPEIKKAIRKNDQHFSRIGLGATEITLGRTEAEVAANAADIAREMLQRLDPEAVAEVHDLATTVVINRGHLRALAKQIALAKHMRSAPGMATRYRDSFLAAHTQLVRDYTL